MHKFLLRSTLLCFFVLSQIPAIAQRSLSDQDPFALYNKGVELYENNHFAAAQMIFKQLVNHDGLTNTMKAEAAYYNAVSSMELFQDDAEPLLLAFMDKYPEHPKARMINYYLGSFYFREKDYAKAAEAFEQVDESDLSQKERYEYLFKTGYSYFRTDNYDKAKQYLKQAKDVPNDNQAIASYYYGYIAYEEEKYNDALAEFLKIKDDKKFQYIVPVYITQIYLLQNKPDKAIEYGEAALRNKETERLDEINLYLAEAYFRKGDYEQAATRYGAYSGGNMTDNHYYQYAYSLYQSGQYKEAITNFNRVSAIKEDTLGQNISYHLGGAYLQTGDKIKARNSFDYAAKLNFLPEIKEQALFNYAKLSYELGFQKESIDALKKLLNNKKYGTEARELLGQILLTTNNPKDALEIFEGIKDLDQGRNDKLTEAYQKILYYYGLELYNNHQFAQSEEMFRKSLKNPIDKKVKALSYFWIAETQYRQDELDNAIANYKNFLFVGEAKQTPYYDVAYYNLGYGYFKQEDYSKAKTYLSRYLEENTGGKTPRYYDAVLRTADANFVLKNYDEAVSQYNEIIRNKASEPDYATYQLGMIQGIQNKYDDKINTMRGLARQYPKSPYIDDALFEVARTYMVRGDDVQAIKEYESLNYNYPKNPYYRLALLNIAQSYFNMGQDNKAVPIFKDIIKKYPYSEEAKQAMRGIQNSYIDRGLTDSLDAFLSSLPSSGLIVSSQDSVLYSSAFSNVKKNDCPAAIRSLETYLSKYPNGYFFTDANYYIAECAMKEKQYSKALKHYNNVIARSPNPYMEQSLLTGADLYYNNEKDYEFAFRRYQQLEEVAANKQNVLIAIQGQIRSHYKLKNYDKVIEAADKLLALAYVDEAMKTEAQFYLGMSQLAQNQLEQAMANFQQVITQNKAELGAEAMYNVAYIQYLQEKYEDAQNTIFELKDRYAFYDYWRAKAFVLLADVYVKLGDDFQAKSTLQSIIDNYEGDQEIITTAKQKLDEIKAREKTNTNEE